jgi:multidrug transporter EmrE-like cation transporter
MSAPLLVLCATSAGFYVAAAVVMKLASHMPFLLLLLPVYAALGLAAWFESLALPGNRLGIVVLLILAGEVLLTAAVAFALGERYGLREIAGLLVIVAGIAVVCSADTPSRPAG